MIPRDPLIKGKSKSCGCLRKEATALIEANKKRSGSRSSLWKGGIYKRAGYICLRAKDHPFAGSAGYVPEHRLVMERLLGRYLFPHETVHHKNGIRDDNRPENLELWSKSHPNGQRVIDKIKWAREILEIYKDFQPEGAKHAT